jgi:hypothetical protein
VPAGAELAATENVAVPPDAVWLDGWLVIVIVLFASTVSVAALLVTLAALVALTTTRN